MAGFGGNENTNPVAGGHLVRVGQRRQGIGVVFKEKGT